jgi:hypothetical protein
MEDRDKKGLQPRILVSKHLNRTILEVEALAHFDTSWELKPGMGRPKNVCQEHRVIEWSNPSWRRTVMTFEQYIAGLPSTLSDVKRQIVQRLWKEGASFPRGWVKSSELLSLTGQKYFDRRVRELRDEMGCDIETGTVSGEHAYRLISTDVEVANPRAYLTESQKKELFRSASNRCAICDRQFESGLRGLQADHKVPLKRGGPHDSANWQPLCVECNVGKRRACAGCELDCQVCPWAFPERVGRRLLVQVSKKVEVSLKEYSVDSGKSLNLCVAEAVAEYVSKKT